MTVDTPEQVLMIEDSESDALIATDALERAAGGATQVSVAQTLDEGLRKLAGKRFELVLLDLGLPDSTGLETLRAVRAATADIPVVVLTGLDDEELGNQAMEAGAQDFLPKAEMTTTLLRRVVRYAVQRQRLQAELDRHREQQARLAEIGNLARLSGEPQTAAVGAEYAGGGLHRNAPAAFDAATEAYGRVLDLRLEEAAKRMPVTSTAALQRLGDEMGRWRCGPRDVVEVHLNALQVRMDAGPDAKARAYMQLGRIAALELMGLLAAFYRPWFHGGGQSP